MLNFSNLPKEKPKTGERAQMTDGRYVMVVGDSEVKQGKNNKYLNVTLNFKGTPRKMWTNLHDTDKPFPLWIFKNFLEAIDLELDGDFDLDTVRKLSKGRELEADVVFNDKGYGEISFDNDQLGFYAIGKEEPVALTEEVANAIDEKVEDEEF